MITTARVEAPEPLRRSIEQGAGTAGRDWCDGLPDLVADLLAAWKLTRTGEQPRAGFGGVAVPVTRTDRSQAILKVTFSIAERDDENAVLAAWAGHRAARLLERDDTRHARLLQRLGEESLFDLDDPVLAMSIAGGLAADLAVPPPPGLQRLSEVAAALATRIADSDRSMPSGLSRRSREAAAATYRELGADQPDTLLHGDLQGRNILRSADGGWAVIDPLGLVGETAIEALTVLRDRWVSLPDQASPRTALLRRLDAFADGAGSSPSRVVAWTHARSVRAVVAGVDDGGLHAWVAEQLDDTVRRCLTKQHVPRPLDPRAGDQPGLSSLATASIQSVASSERWRPSAPRSPIQAASDVTTPPAAVI